ncbi:MAG: DUF2058 domain-containing protein [Gammaproteobacteria bacterium]|nr:DUF2058 domain-containing protein [Gammaproteobacteria bacterium]MDH3535476.1 DUF2058 domain-containing protein [Gammaproteobacteria bacterium]
MSSLQEQLLKAGLVDQQKLARADQEKNRQSNLARKKHGKNSVQPGSSRQQEQNKKAQRNRELKQKRQHEAQRKGLAAQTKHLIDINKQDRAQGEHPYSFVYRGKVKKIYVSERQKTQLVGGQLAIATFVTNDGRKFELVPQAVAEKIIERDDTLVVDLGQPAKTDQDENDPYADYQVPDDLIW